MLKAKNFLPMIKLIVFFMQNDDLPINPSNKYEGEVKCSIIDVPALIWPGGVRWVVAFVCRVQVSGLICKRKTFE